MPDGVHGADFRNRGEVGDEMTGRSVGSVLKGLGCCTSGRGKDCCIGCPYAFSESDNCSGDLMRDAREAIAYLMAERKSGCRQPQAPQSQVPQQEVQKEAVRSRDALVRGLIDGDITKEAFLGAWNGTRG